MRSSDPLRLASNSPPKVLRLVGVDSAIDQSAVAIYLADPADFRPRVGKDGILDDVTAEDLQQLIAEVASTPDRRFTVTAAPDPQRAQESHATPLQTPAGADTW